jgi:hypothetical protein
MPHTKALSMTDFFALLLALTLPWFGSAQVTSGKDAGAAFIDRIVAD